MIYEHSYSKIIKTPYYTFDPPIEEEIQEFSKQFTSNAIKQETNNEIKFNVVVNDGKRLSLALLTGLKNIFMKQLPKMPKEYISRLVYDKNHTSMIIVGPNNSALGGITYRLFDQRQFAEIVFCAIASSEQVKGYGSHLMNHLKDYIMMHTNARYFLTYADNYAIGYFKKQGFTKDITLDQKIWVGYIKDYEGGTLMQCTMIPRLTYLRVKEILAFQKKVLNKKIQSVSSSHIVYEGLSCFENGVHEIDPMDIPGVKDSGYDPAIHKSKQPRRTRFQNQLLRLVSELKSHRASWPFLEPVNGEDVTDYYEIIQNPMDLSTLEKNVLDNKYASKEDFIRDTKFIFSNCRFYNDQNSAYFKSADQLEEYFEQRLSQWRD